MASENVHEFTDANFAAEVEQSDQPVLVDFWATWCQPCLALAPTIDALADEFKGQVKVGKLDTDNNKDSALKYGITGIPTVMVFKGGEVVKKLQGVRGKDDYAAAVHEVLAPTA